MKGLMGGLYRISEWIMRLSAINLLWLLCSFPLVYFGLVMLQVDSIEQFNTLLIMIGVISPFTLFPATAAMFAVARKWVMGEVDVPLFKTFFKGYKENYVQSMVGGILYMLLFVVMVFNYNFYRDQAGTMQLLQYLFVAFFVVLFISLCHFFSIMVHFHMKLLAVIKNAILITIGRPLNALFIIIVNGSIIYVSFAKFTFLIPFFMGALIAYLSFMQFYRIYTKTQELLEKEALAAAEAEEEEQQRLSGSHQSGAEDSR